VMFYKWRVLTVDRSAPVKVWLRTHALARGCTDCVATDLSDLAT